MAIDVQDVRLFIAKWKLLYHDRYFGNDAETVAMIVQDCQGVPNGRKLLYWLDDYVDKHGTNRPTWAQFRAYAQRRANWTPTIGGTPEHSMWAGFDAAHGITEDDGEPMEIGSVDVLARLARVKRKMARAWSGRIVSRDEPTVVVAHIPADIQQRAVRAADALKADYVTRDVPMGEIPF